MTPQQAIQTLLEIPHWVLLQDSSLVHAVRGTQVMLEAQERILFVRFFPNMELRLATPEKVQQFVSSQLDADK